MVVANFIGGAGQFCGLVGALVKQVANRVKLEVERFFLAHQRAHVPGGGHAAAADYAEAKTIVGADNGCVTASGPDGARRRGKTSSSEY